MRLTTLIAFGAALSFVVGTVSSEAAVVVFRQGLDGYMGTQDTQIEPGGTTPNGDVADVTIDLDTAGDPNGFQALIRFDNIFQADGGRIPTGSTINSATLSVFSFDGSGATAMINLNRMLIDWDEATSTWTSLFGPLVPDGVNVSLDVDAQIPTPNVVNEFEIMDVTEAVLAWQGGDDNFGWLISQDTTGGYDFYTSEHPVEEQRPSLTVDFTPPDRQPDFNNDGVVNNADFVILRGNMYKHLDGLAVAFEDGDVDFDLDVDLFDFRKFKSQFPAAVGSAAGVPEPSALVLAVAVLAGLLLARRRRTSAA